MTRSPLAMLAAAVAMLAGCGALNPYPTVPRAAQPGQPPGPRVAICYNGMAAAATAVQAEAQQECPAGTLAEPVDTDWYMQNCPVLLPERATFVCSSKQ
jgi:hypothetical protein